jgi:hypothetical protein
MRVFKRGSALPSGTHSRSSKTCAFWLCSLLFAASVETGGCRWNRAPEEKKLSVEVPIPEAPLPRKPPRNPAARPPQEPPAVEVKAEGPPPMPTAAAEEEDSGIAWEEPAATPAPVPSATPTAAPAPEATVQTVQ